MTLLEFGESAYKEAIENSLDEATVLIVISSDVQYLNSRWIKYEWSSFHEEILSGDKEKGIIIPYLSGNITRKERPLALRNLETFSIEADTIEKVVDFTMNYLYNNKIIQKEEVKIERNAKLASTYSPINHSEHRRLKTQALYTKDADMPAINYVLEKLKDKKEINILDCGCAYGYVTFDRFSDIENAKIVGIDNQEKCIKYAIENKPNDKFSFYVKNLESKTFTDDMLDLMDEKHIEKFDIIFSSLVIHHLNDPLKTLRSLRKLLSDDGFIILRGSDDGSAISYNDDGLVKKIIDKTMQIPGISDRLNGRKIYYQLYTSGYKQLKMFNWVKEISDCDYDKRINIFNERFSYRSNYLENILKKDPTNIEIKNDLEWMEYALNKLEELFGNESFWYQEVDFVCVGRKK